MRRLRETLTATYAAGTEQLPVQGQWTYVDYARLPDDGWRYEVIRGELHMSPAPRPLHQDAITLLSFFLVGYLRKRNLGKAYVSPIDVILPGKLGDPVQPDILFIRSDRLHIIGETFIDGAPDLVMEVLSPSNPAHDRSLKYQLYAEAGVPEYWIIDPHERRDEVFVLRGGDYELLGRYGDNDTARSEVLEGFAFKPDEIFPA